MRTNHRLVRGPLSLLLLAAPWLLAAGCGDGASASDDMAAFDFTGEWIQISSMGSSTCGGKSYMETSAGFSRFVISKSGSMYVLQFKLQDGSDCMLNFLGGAGQITAQPGQVCGSPNTPVTFDSWTFTPSGTQLAGEFETTAKVGSNPGCTPFHYTFRVTLIRK